MYNYLVTGGAGFIGSTLVNRISKDNNVVIVDDLSMGDITKIKDINKTNVDFIEGSVTDEQLMTKIFNENQFDYIFHLAAVASVADSVVRPVETHEVNFESVLLLLELCRKNQKNLKRLVFSSSAAVYGDEPTLPKLETSTIKPLTPYAVDKFAAERYVLNYNSLYNLPTSAVRFFNVYGPNQNPNSPYSGVLSILTDRYETLLNGEESSFTIFGDGEQRRDFVYIDDVVDALLLVADSVDSLGNVYNVGTGNATSLNDIVSVYRNYLNKSISVNYEEKRDGDIQDSYSDISNLNRLGFFPKYSVTRGIEAYLEYALKN
ncbi:NAD-dependent epimerase/dehydratase family protein [Enterococcus diestrammenae]|uniref:UDP-glucose 4-epimerase n=1 Tax=Enterococcus diestrammenae TaxID=1155073 RepID=A0ABV0F1P9_9ENTE|nr:NAD-dependent epimerase/dehydratase family protein [Enterococcus diestrammenae]KAF1294985.1 epimerase [Enterococcus diestrammenae]